MNLECGFYLEVNLLSKNYMSVILAQPTKKVIISFYSSFFIKFIIGIYYFFLSLYVFSNSNSYQKLVKIFY